MSLVATSVAIPLSPYLSECPSARALCRIPISLFAPPQYIEYLDNREDLDKLELLLASKGASNLVYITSLEGVGNIRVIIVVDIVRENIGVGK